MKTMKFYVAVLLILIFETSSLAATRTDPVVASFDCKKAQTNYETLVCSDYGLAGADRQMSGTYRQALILTPSENEKRTIVSEQRKWLATTTSLLQEKSHSMSMGELKKFLDRILRERIGALSPIKSELGKTIILDNSPESKAVCSSLLTAKNIIWEGVNDVGQDHFTLSPPSGFSSPPEWDNVGIAGHAKFDFMNTGKPADVFSVSKEGTHIQFHYYIVATPEEENTIEKLLDVDGSMNDAMNVAGEFTNATPSTRINNSPKLKSIIFDTSSSPVYGWGWYTDTQVIQKDEVTYLISTSVNNLEGPTFTIFKPKGSHLNPICYYRAFPTTRSEVTTQLDSKFKCPYGVKSAKSPFDQDKDRTISINLKEWGGSRPVTSKCYVLGHKEVCHLSVGNTHGSLDEQDSWQPLKELQGESQSFLTIPDGAYIVNYGENEVTYYRIINDELVPACSVADKLTPYSGYQNRATQNSE